MRLKVWEYGILVTVVILLTALFVYGATTLRPVSYEAITIDNTLGGKSLTTAKYFNATTSRILSDLAIVNLEAANVYYTVDGVTVPTTGGIGTLLYVGQSRTLTSFEQIQNFRAIRASGTSGVIKVEYYKRYEK